MNGLTVKDGSNGYFAMDTITHEWEWHESTDLFNPRAVNWNTKIDEELYFNKKKYKEISETAKNYMKWLDTDAVDYNKISTERRKTEVKEYVNLKKHFDYGEVIFNNPATIVIWKDGTKTVVKCGNGDNYDPEKGLALCFMKKALGNKSGPFNKVLKKEMKCYQSKTTAKQP